MLPLPTESPSLDTQEEVCASPKFKKALMQRYLNNSFEAPPHHIPGEDTCSPSMPNQLTTLEGEGHFSMGHHKILETPKSSTTLPHPLPLCTSSPKENFQARWNTSFQHVKDTKFPAASVRLTDKTDIRVRSFASGRGQGEEEGRVVKKYERQRNQDHSCGTLKKQKTQRDHFQTSDPCTSSSLTSESRLSAGGGFRTITTTSDATTHFPSVWPTCQPFVDVPPLGELEQTVCVVWVFCTA